MEEYTIERGGAKATVCSRGAVVTSWVIPTAPPFNIIDGYRSRDEVEEGDGCRSAILAPWSNRIADARYTHADIEYDLGTDEDGRREALHGLVTEADFTVVDQSHSAISLATVIDADTYPHRVRIVVTYELGQRADSWILTTRIKGYNLGTGPTPMGLGWHPYICYDGPRDQAYVTLPARTTIRTDDSLIPLEGDLAFASLETYDPVTGLATIKPLENLDTAFSDLTATPGEEALVTATLHHGSGAKTTMVATAPASFTKASGIVHLFTGEVLENRPGESLAFEYCQFMTDAFNRAECRDQLEVGPGDTRSMTVSLIHTPSP